MRPCQLRQSRGGWNERFEVRRQWISLSRADDVWIFLRRICAIDRRHFARGRENGPERQDTATCNSLGAGFRSHSFLTPLAASHELPLGCFPQRSTATLAA